MTRKRETMLRWSIILLVFGLIGLWYRDKSDANASSDRKDKIIQDLIDYNNQIRNQAQASGIQVPPIPESLTGAEGPQGRQGPQGLEGVPGIQGVPGKDGAPGPAGPSGEPGSNGLNGEGGPAGPEGTPGQTGQPGTDGQLPSQYTVTHDDGSVETCNLRADQSGYDCTITTPPTTTTTLVVN